jgi:UDP-N-acetylmuramoylalanine--D-glutamate ligase
MSQFQGTRAAVAGLGVSGIAAAEALRRRGAEVTAYDERPLEGPARIAAADRLQAKGIHVVSSWSGRLNPEETDLLVASPGFPGGHPMFADMAGRQVWGEIALAHAIARAPIAAVTGTNGKSTTVVMLWSLLRAAGIDAILCGNIAGSGFPEMTLTEAAERAEPGQVLAAEISSFQLERAGGFRPRAAAITRITPDHLDRHPDFADYQAAKLRLFERMGEGDVIARSPGAPGIPEEAYQVAAARGVRIEDADPSALINGRQADWDGIPIDLARILMGAPHDAANAVLAWRLARVFTEAKPAMAEALHTLPGLAHRLEKLGERGGVLVINSSMTTNPDALIAASKAVPRPQRILIGGKTKNLDFAPVAEYLRQSGQKAVLFGPDAGIMNRTLGGGWPEHRTLEAAFFAAAAEAREGEAILLAPGCASAAPYSSFRERGEDFRRMAKDWLDEGSKDCEN